MMPPALYIHIPFCSSRCHYCNFYFETGWSERILRNTLDRSLEEFQQYYRELGYPGISTVYLGGGTPSVIPPEMMGDYLSRLFRLIRRDNSLPKVMELDVEANPESLSRDFLERIAAESRDHCSTLRLSLGVQSFQRRILRSLGRVSSTDDIYTALKTALEFKSDAPLPFALNCDLIYGAGEQSLEDFQEDLQELLNYDPDGISLYELTVEERTPLAQAVAAGRKTVADAPRLDSLWALAQETLGEHGYRNYEISNFSRPGKESKHNFAYWRLRPYIGIGPGAVSTLPFDSRPVRIENPDLFEYRRLDFGQNLLHPGPGLPRPCPGESTRDLPGETAGYGDGQMPRHISGRSVQELTGNELFLEMFITGLRTIAGVGMTDIQRIFGNNGAALATQIASGWKDHLQPHPRRIILKSGSRFTMDVLLKQLPELLEDHPRLRILQWP